MIKNPDSAFRAALLALATVAPAFGQYGGLDGTFTPYFGAGGAVHSLVQQPDGSILIAGIFTEIKDLESAGFETRYRVARFSNGGILDENYSPDLNGAALNTLVMPDGSAFFSGAFSQVNTLPTSGITARASIARFGSNGTVDPDFISQLNVSSITSMGVNQNKQMLVACDAGLYCLNLNGTNDGQVVQVPNFYSYTGSSVAGLVVQPDQKILMYGPFALYSNVVGSGVNSPYLEIVSSTGRFRNIGPQPYYADINPFTPSLGPDPYCAAIQPDGKILVGGRFSSPLTGLFRLKDPNLPMSNSTTPHPHAGGVLDDDFTEIHQVESGQPFLDGAVRAIALQTDGRILIGGDFTRVRAPVKVDGAWRYDTHYGIARLMPDGRLDTSFDAQIRPTPGVNGNFSVTGISLQKDGRVLINGTFQRIGPSSTEYTLRPLAARLTNSDATESLTTTGTSITWLRGGSSPEASEVIFEWRSASSSNNPWQLADTNGIAVRTAGGWTKTLSSAIPASSYIRASARTTGGIFNGSSGIASTTIGYKVPVVGLRRDTPFTPLLNGGSTSFETVGIGRPKDIAFTLTNTGDGAMSGISAQLTGGQSNQFSFVTLPPTSLAIGASAPIVIRFNPTSTGNKTTTFRIINSPGSAQFNITLNGTAVTEMEGFRYEYFGSTANSGNGADGADPDGDGHTNLFEFVAGLIPNDRSSKFEQRVDRSTGTPKVIFSPIVANRTYEVQTNTTLGTWVAATGGSTSNSGAERTYTHTGVTDPKRFYRIKITK
ncbi:MAG TPA: hypothetical protein VM511_12890 [Luteolibacter sp.]|nr:hypothetical protein [Luteolibacter sp.]